MSWAGLYLALTYNAEARAQAAANLELLMAARDAELKADPAPAEPKEGEAKKEAGPAATAQEPREKK